MKDDRGWCGELVLIMVVCGEGSKSISENNNNNDGIIVQYLLYDVPIS